MQAFDTSTSNNIKLRLNLYRAIFVVCSIVVIAIVVVCMIVQTRDTYRTYRAINIVVSTVYAFALIFVLGTKYRYLSSQYKMCMRMQSAIRTKGTYITTSIGTLTTYRGVEFVSIEIVDKHNNDNNKTILVHNSIVGLFAVGAVLDIELVGNIAVGVVDIAE